MEILREKKFDSKEMLKNCFFKQKKDLKTLIFDLKK